MSAKRVTVERTIAAPPEVVFARSSDVRSWPEVVPAIQRVELLTEGPIGRGTRFRETRTMFGREATEEMEFMTFEPPRGYVLGAESHGCRYRTEFRFEPSAAGTRVVMEFSAEPLTWTAKAMTALMKPMLRKVAELCGKDLDALKASIERDPQAPDR